MSEKSKDRMSRLGSYVSATAAGDSYQAFLPSPLPPEPPIDLLHLQNLLMRAGQAVSRLDAVSEVLPHTDLLLYYYIRKEAVLSSQIEGTQSSLSDLLLYESRETPSVPLDDVIEVSSYVAALQHGLARMQAGFPFSLRLIREMHEILMRNGRGSNKQPGEFRRSQNWLGGSKPGNAIYIPPPPEYVTEMLDSFEKYIHAENSPYPTLIDAGLLHVQFETIHPFLDGNGRLGRLIITMYLIMKGDLKHPYLYLSLYFKKNRQEYYQRLNEVRRSGDWEGWFDFFLTGVAETADQIIDTSKEIEKLFSLDLNHIASLKRAGIRARAAHEVLRKRAIISAIDAAALMNTTVQTSRAALLDLKDLGIVADISGTGKERLYVYTNLVRILEKGALPIAY